MRKVCSSCVFIWRIAILCGQKDIAKSSEKLFVLRFTCVIRDRERALHVSTKCDKSSPFGFFFALDVHSRNKTALMSCIGYWNGNFWPIVNFDKIKLFFIGLVIKSQHFCVSSELVRENRRYLKRLSIVALKKTVIICSKVMTSLYRLKVPRLRQ